MSKRRRYSPEFKREAVALAQQPGVSCRQVALEIGVNPNLLTRWKREISDSSGKAFGGSGTPAMRSWPVSSESWPGSRRNGIFCAKRQRSSQRSRPEVSGDSTLSQRTPYTTDVPVPEGITQRLLCLGITPSQCL